MSKTPETDRTPPDAGPEDVTTPAPAPDPEPTTIDPAAELAAQRERIATLETLHLKRQAQGVKGHRPAAEIRDDLVKAKGELTRLIGEKDRQEIRAGRERKIRDVQRKLAASQSVSAGFEFVASEWEATQPEIFRPDPELLTKLHRQHYVVAGLEAEREALAKELGPLAAIS